MAWPAGSRFHYLYERERAVMPELLGRRRILIVEDDWMVAEDMSYMVEELGGAVVGPAGQLAQASRSPNRNNSRVRFWTSI
jgi:hypothetical protein